MAKIVPFRGVLYHPKRIRQIASVVAPPYDIISQKAQEEFYRRSEYNVVRLEYGKCFKNDTPNRNCYTRAQAFFRSWLSKGILKQDPDPAVYAYLQRFPKGTRGRRVERWGFIALLKLEREGYASVYPHEHTLVSPKEDRLKLMHSLQANISPLFFLFSDKRRQVERLLQKSVSAQRPLWRVTREGETHALWRLHHPQLISALQRSFRQKRLFIADGHHRFEVALAFRDQMGKRGEDGNRLPWNYVMAYFSNLLDDNLMILPIHRLIRRLPYKEGELLEHLKGLFTIKRIQSLRSLLSHLERSKRPYLYGMVVSRRPYLLRLRRGVSVAKLTAHCPHSSAWKKLEVTVLHEVVLKRLLGCDEETIRKEVTYERHLPTCIRELNQGQYKVGFFLRAPRIQEVRRIALSREKMPQKSTYFHPKPLTGLVLHRFALPSGGGL